ncbi:MAG TPA: TIGR03067 domain-containing protein [Chloroflexota bacterium]|nr:TIGR03067 domain-containing protein [Chloroflexota bacterium]
MTRFALLALVIVLSAIGMNRADETAELAKLKGTWRVLKAVRNGESAPDVVRVALKVTVTDRALTIRSAENVPTVLEAEIALDPSKSPATIELKPKQSGNTVLHGIYEFDGETLRLCWTRNGGPRPSDFTAKSGSNAVYFELNREVK